MVERQIFGFSGVLEGGADGFRLIEHAVGLGRGPRVYRAMVTDGTLPPGYASEDGVGLHYVGTELREAVTVRPGAAAWWVDRTRRRRIPARTLEPDSRR